MESSPRRDYGDPVSTWSDPAEDNSSDVLVIDPDGDLVEPASPDEVDEPLAPPTFDDELYQREQVSAVYAAAPGVPGRGIIIASLGATTGCALIDLALTGGISMFFDLCFVIVCLVGAMAVRRSDLFTTGVLPPLVFGAVIAGISVLAPTTFVASGDLSRVFLTGLAVHAGALVSGYAVALATVAGRVSAARG